MWPRVKTCAVYARVSTDMQEGSLVHQIDFAQEYIRRLGGGYCLNEACVYADSDQSGYYTRFVQRPAIQRALADAKAGKYDVIVFKELSRISRDQAEHIEIVTRFTQYGVRMIAINDNLDSDRPETLDLLGIHSVMAEMESKRISSRVSSGKKSLARRGVWSGEAPIGYVLNPSNHRLVIDDRCAEIPRTIFRLFTLERFGTQRIAEYLNDHGLWTKHQRPWSRTTVNHVLKNPVYVGDLVYGRTRNTLKRVFDESGYSKTQGKHRVPSDDWIVVANAHPALVDRDVFERAQLIFRDKQRQPLRRIRHPLSGLLRCGRCGSGMICQTQRSGNRVYRYYMCAKAFRYGRQQCSQPNVKAELAESAVLQSLLRCVAPYAECRVRVQRRQRQSTERKQRDRLQRQLEEAQLGLSRLLRDPDIPPHTFGRLKDSLLQDIGRLEQELETVDNRVRRLHEWAERPMSVSDYLATWKTMDPNNPEALRRLFQSAADTVVMDGRTLTSIHWKYKMP